MSEVFLGTVLFFDIRHHHRCQDVLSLGGEGQCLQPGGAGVAPSQGFAQWYPFAPSLFLTNVVYTKATTAAATSAMKMRRRMKKN